MAVGQERKFPSEWAHALLYSGLCSPGAPLSQPPPRRIWEAISRPPPLPAQRERRKVRDIDAHVLRFYSLRRLHVQNPEIMDPAESVQKKEFHYSPLGGSHHHGEGEVGGRGSFPDISITSYRCPSTVRWAEFPPPSTWSSI